MSTSALTFNLQTLLLALPLFATSARGSPNPMLTPAPTPSTLLTTTAQPCSSIQSVCIDYIKDCTSTTLGYGGCTTFCSGHPIPRPTSTPTCPGGGASLDARAEASATCSTLIYDGVKQCASTSIGFGGTITRCPGTTVTNGLTAPACPEETATSMGQVNPRASAEAETECQFITYDAVRECGSTSFWYGGVATSCPGDDRKTLFTTAACPTATPTYQVSSCQAITWDAVRECGSTSFWYGGVATSCPGDDRKTLFTTAACPTETAFVADAAR